MMGRTLMEGVKRLIGMWVLFLLLGGHKKTALHKPLPKIILVFVCACYLVSLNYISKD